MMQLNRVLVLSFAIFSLLTFESAFAKTQSSDESRDVRSVVEEYFAFEQFLKTSPRDPNCRPSSSCLKVACSSLGRFECDEADEVDQVTRACRGSWGGECILVAKKYLGRFEIDELPEMISLIESCRGLYDFDCVDYTCQRVGRFGCDELDEMRKVNSMCAGR